MTEFERVRPPKSGPEKEMLSAYLDFNRATILHKITGLNEEDLRRKVPANGNSLLGLVKHLAYVERWWFQDIFSELKVNFPWTAEDPDSDFRVEENETSADIIALFKTEVEISQRITRESSLEDMSKKRDSNCSLRWVLLHMVEEYSRHNGQADIMRELIDGTVGY